MLRLLTSLCLTVPLLWGGSAIAQSDAPAPWSLQGGASGVIFWAQSGNPGSYLYRVCLDSGPGTVQVQHGDNARTLEKDACIDLNVNNDALMVSNEGSETQASGVYRLIHVNRSN